MRVSPDGMVSQMGEPGAAPSPAPLQTRAERRRAELPLNGAQKDDGTPLDSPRSMLVQVIEGEIIPRLFMAHAVDTPNLTEKFGELADCTFLAELFLHNDCPAIVARLQALLDRGVSCEHVYLELLAPVPRTLSLFWAEDRCSFNDMAQGLSRVNQVLQEMHAREYAAFT